MVDTSRSSLRGRVPQQERSQQRMAAVLNAADVFVARFGPESASIPEIAMAAGVPRASIYQFYPDKYALLSHVAERHLERLIDRIHEGAPALANTDQRSAIRTLVDIAADYFNDHATASSLLLAGPFSRPTYLGRRAQVSRIGPLLRSIGVGLRPMIDFAVNPEMAYMASEIALACLRFSYLRDGRIVDRIRAQAALAVCSYVANWEGSRASVRPAVAAE